MRWFDLFRLIVIPGFLVDFWSDLRFYDEILGHLYVMWVSVMLMVDVGVKHLRSRFI